MSHFTTHPQCLSHSEHHIQWSILHFLLEVTQNPVAGLKKRLLANDFDEFQILPGDALPSPTTDDVPKTGVRAGSIDQNPSEFGYYNDESDLSDWTDSELDENDDDGAADEILVPFKSPSTKPALPPKPVAIVTKLEPPKRSLNYKKFDSSFATVWLKENVQSDWWRKTETSCPVTSTKHQTATFCDYWNQLLARASSNHIKLERISTVSEYCLAREICWMFVRPATMKFFRLESGDRIRLQHNISIPSVTLKGMRSFLREFVEKMTIMHMLRQFCVKVQGGNDSTTIPPHTIEAYAAEISKCLEKITRIIIEKEKAIMTQLPGTVETVLELYNYLRPHFQFLEYLWIIHKTSVVDWHKYSNHVCSSHLLAGLAMRIVKARNNEMAALACALYIRSLKAYLGEFLF